MPYATAYAPGISRNRFMAGPQPVPAPEISAPLGPEYSADRAKLRSEHSQDEGSQQGSFFGLMDALQSRGFLKPGGGGSASVGAAGAGTWTPEMPTAGSVGVSGPRVAHVDASGARSAAFNRAKDKVGETGTGAIAALRSVMAGRGMLGSGREARASANVINAGQQQLGEVTREGAIQDAAQAEREALTNYEGDITQRGQDLAALAERNRLRLAARGQDLSAESAASEASDSRLRAILGLYSAFRGGARY